MSNSSQPHGLQPARLLCPWDFPSKITGVGCHALLQGIVPDQGMEPMSPASPALQVDSLSTEPPGKPHMPLKGANNGDYCPAATKLN